MPLPYGQDTGFSYLQNADQAVAGLIIQNVKTDTFVNAATDAYQSVSIAIGTAATSTAYTITALGTTITYTSGGTDTAALIAIGLYNALSGSVIAGRFTVTYTATTVVLTNTIYGNDTVVTVAGGGTGYAATNTASVNTATIGHGLVIATKSPYPVIDGVPSAALPAASTDRVLGVSAASHAEVLGGNIPTAASGTRSGDMINVLSIGAIYAVAEIACLATDATVYYRHTANGANTTIGVLSNASGTGLSSIAGIGFAGNSFVTRNGVILVPVNVNLV